MNDDKKDEVKPGEPSKTDDFVYKRDSSKTLRQIGKEVEDRRRKRLKEKKDEKVEDISKVETPLTEKAEEKPEKEPKPEIKEPVVPIDPDQIADKAAEKAATKVAEDTKIEFQAKIDEILNKDKDILDKQKEADELIASWDKEGRLPNDYNELITETMRIADAKMEQKMKARDEKAAEERNIAEKEKTDKETLVKTETNKQLEDFNKQIAADLNDIYDGKFLPRPATFEEINNPNTTDPAAKETQKVLEFGVKLNTRLVSEGKDPVTSLNKIYFLHYKPTMDKVSPKDEQPAGADAPIAGAKNTPAPNTSGTLGIPIEQLRNESWGQTKARLAREFAKKLIGK